MVPANWSNKVGDATEVAKFSSSGKVEMLLEQDPPRPGPAERQRRHRQHQRAAAGLTPSPHDQVATYLQSVSNNGATNLSAPQSFTIDGATGQFITYDRDIQGTPGESQDMIINHGGSTYDIVLNTSQFAFSQQQSGLQAVLAAWQWSADVLIMMSAQATPAEIANVMSHVRDRGYKPIELPGADRLAIGVLGSNPLAIRDAVVALPGVVDAIPVSKPYKMVGLEWHPERTVVHVGGVRIGDGSLTVAAGPCAVETEAQLLDTATSVAAAGATLLRGGAYKPRSSPYSFRGLGRARASSTCATRASSPGCRW